MAIAQRLDLRQSQTLIMTPQLQQAIKLLQLSNLDLATYVDAEIERNPLLERDDAPQQSGTTGDGAEPADGTPPPAPSDTTGTDRLTASDTWSDSDPPLDADFDNVWSEADMAGAAPPQHADWGTGRTAAGSDDGEALWERTLSSGASLRDFLLSQVNEEFADPVDRVIGAHLVDQIDECGYLAGETDAIAETLGCTEGRLEAVLARMQRFDPPGIFARSLKECLAIQLRELNRLDPAMACLLDNLDLLARRDHAQLRARCGVDDEDLHDMITEIRALSPKPALAFADDVAQPVTPDILMRPNPAGGWIVELNSDTLPRVLVNRRYYATVSSGTRTKTDRDYLSDCLASANWLAKALHQRATTILKVATEIVQQQTLFFGQGVQHLRPLVLRDIAEAIGMHESTVSRVTSNKYMATPRGIYELKYFFTAAIGGTDGAEAHSAEAVRFRIKSLIDAEPPAAILSDDRIVEILRGEGIDIARRTVAKYRETMRIPSSVQRRRDKAMWS